MTKTETIRALESALLDKEKEILKLTGEIAALRVKLDFALNKLSDTQSRIRKLNWMLEQTDEVKNNVRSS